MKTIEISDVAFQLISHHANRLTNGNIAELIDRQFGVGKDGRDFEPLPAKIEAEFVRKCHPEALGDEDAIRIILGLIQDEAPRRFESIVGFRFTDKNHVVVSRSREELPSERPAHEIGDTGVFMVGGLSSKERRKLFHQLLRRMGYPDSRALELERFVLKTAALKAIADRYVE